MQRNVVTVVVMGLMTLAVGSQIRADDPLWAHKMFDKLEHDFGVVPSNADLKFRLKITNLYKETVHISNVSSSCGCTAGKPSKDTLGSEEVAWLDLSMDSRRLWSSTRLSLTYSWQKAVLCLPR